MLELIAQFHAISGQPPKTIVLGSEWHKRCGHADTINGIRVVVIDEDPWAFGMFSLEADDGA
jgi:hypothetical protein